MIISFLYLLYESKLGNKLETNLELEDIDENINNKAFESFEGYLVKSKKTAKDYFPILVAGPWGSGKTLLLKRIRRFLLREDKVDNGVYTNLVVYKTFMEVNNYEDLLVSVLEDIANQIEDETGLLLRNDLLEYAERVSDYEYLKPLKVLSAFFKNREATKDELFEKLNVVLDKKKIRLFIIIDEVERIVDASKMLDVMKLVVDLQERSTGHIRTLIAYNPDFVYPKIGSTLKYRTKMKDNDYMKGALFVEKNKFYAKKIKMESSDVEYYLSNYGDKSTTIQAYVTILSNLNRTATFLSVDREKTKWERTIGFKNSGDEPPAPFGGLSSYRESKQFIVEFEESVEDFEKLESQLFEGDMDDKLNKYLLPILLLLSYIKVRSRKLIRDVHSDESTLYNLILKEVGLDQLDEKGLDGLKNFNRHYNDLHKNDRIASGEDSIRFEVRLLVYYLNKYKEKEDNIGYLKGLLRCL